MKRIFLALTLMAAAVSSHAGFFTYDISSPDDLTNIAVGQTVHFDVSLPGISTQTWDDTAIFNAFANSSDTTLWDAPINVNFNPALSVITETSLPGRLSFVHVDTALTMVTDFVMSFDIAAVAAGAGTFSANGADVFEASGLDEAFFTFSDSVDFNIVAAAVPEPGAVGLIGLSLLLFAARRRRVTNR